MKIGDSIKFTYNTPHRSWRNGVLRQGRIELIQSGLADATITIKYDAGHEETMSGFASFKLSRMRNIQTEECK